MKGLKFFSPVVSNLSIFGHLFHRLLLLLLGLAFLFFSIISDYLNETSDAYSSQEGEVFTSSILGAVKSNLYEKKYADVIDYCMGVLKQAQSVQYIIISTTAGEELVINEDAWQMREKTLGYADLAFNASDPRAFLQDSRSLLTHHEDVYVYHRPILLSGEKWGVMTVIFSTDVEQVIKKSLLLKLMILTLAMGLASILMLVLITKKVRNQLKNISDSATAISTGNLEVKLPDNMLGELRHFSRSINHMLGLLSKNNQQLFRVMSAIEQTDEVFIMIDATQHVIFVNQKVKHVFGIDVQALIGLNLDALSDLMGFNRLMLQTDIQSIYKRKKIINRDIRMEGDDGPLDLEYKLEHIVNANDNSDLFLMVLSDISDRKLMEKDLNLLAYQDQLTKLPNRAMFLKALEDAIKDGKKFNTQFALLFIDVDNFKLINDTLGHNAGDEFLVGLSKLLKKNIGSHFLARLGGDEFIIIAPYKEFNKIIILADGVLNSIKHHKIKFKKQQNELSATIGISCFPQHGQDIFSLLKYSDTAMYEAKKNGKNQYAVFDENMAEKLKKNVQLETDLRMALNKKDEITSFYQPIYSNDGLNIKGFEALARWRHPKFGFVSPIEFINLAESKNYIIQLSDYLLAGALADFKQLLLRHPKAYLSFNVSPKYFVKHNFVEFIADQVKACDIPIHQVQLEFTEAVLIEASEETITKLNRLKELGFIIALDDFGTGYSSLNYILQLPLDVVKIDRAFISQVDSTDSKGYAVLATIIELCKKLGIETIAEGVETKEQNALLKNLACANMQGYLFSKPQPCEYFLNDNQQRLHA